MKLCGDDKYAPGAASLANLELYVTYSLSHNPEEWCKLRERSVFSGLSDLRVYKSAAWFGELRKKANFPSTLYLTRLD